jgi:hypothetical protein
LYLTLVFSYPRVGRNVYNFHTYRLCFDKAISKCLFLIIHSHLSACTKQLRMATLSFATAVRWSTQNTANPTAGIYVKFHICDVYKNQILFRLRLKLGKSNRCFVLTLTYMECSPPRTFPFFLSLSHLPGVYPSLLY